MNARKARNEAGKNGMVFFARADSGCAARTEPEPALPCRKTCVFRHGGGALPYKCAWRHFFVRKTLSE